MKKIIAILLTMSVLFSLLSACSPSDNSSYESSGQSSEIQSETSQESEAVIDAKSTTEVPLDTLTVGTGEMNGDFISGFGNNAYDLSIKVLLSGYSDTYSITKNGDIVLNETIVQNLEITTDEDGNQIYTFTLNDGLLWNNGDQITAKDYVASIMWYSSPKWAEAGASSSGSDALIGYTEYYEGTSDIFKGVKLISDLQFSMTVAAENFPYFWDGVNVMVGPIHFDTYLPSCEIISTEEGTSLSFSEGDLLSNCQRIAETERFAPTVTCGPYKFISYENQTVTLELNEHFNGDLDGNKPSLQYIVQKAVPSETNAEWVINGQVDIVEGIVEGEKIESAKTSDNVSFNAYPRSGFGYLAMLCDIGPTADVNVRWALASLIDRTAVVEYVLGGYGSTVDSEYGVGQWMYQDMAAELQEALKPISFNIDTANDYLDLTDWIYESDGSTAFDRTKANAEGTYLRHNESGEVLTINHLSSNDNVLSDIIEIQYIANTPLAGIKFNYSRFDYSTASQTFNDSYMTPDDERIYNTFSAATNFSSVFDRYYSWHSDFIDTRLNKGQISDAELDSLIIAMRETDPNDKEAYLEHWLDYQVRWNELMPQVPLYSNEYYDIYHNNVDNYTTTAFAGYENLICEISKSEK